MTRFSTPKRFLIFLLLAASLAACRADQTSPGLAPVSTTPGNPSATPPAGAETACPRLSATQTGIVPATQTAEALFATLAAIHTQTAQAPTATPTPQEQDSGFGWCADAVVSCFADGYSFPLQRPIPTGIDPTYRFASTQNGDREIHRGVEFYQASGTPVLAVGAGRVAFAGDDMDDKVALWPGFYGNYVVIEHDFGGQPVFTLYGHLSKMDVQTGEAVAAGQKIGEVGASGSAIGSHLHFEVRPRQNDYFAARNPELWFAPLEGMGALAGQIFDPSNPKVSGAVRIQRMEDGKIADFPAYQSLDIYPPELAVENGENFALNDLPAGQYRLTYVYGGKVYEYFIEIGPGILTLITIVLD
ncbi:MAG: peptidoglycan DD-metalloendopeptidase family protein [Anaerolineae bacterium]|nr:peptidoglycan DD-metalloendopeptidase family protein [Anaerolineae bacterium]